MSYKETFENNVRAVRDSLIEAVNSKGAEVPEDTKIGEIVPYIEGIQSGGYKVVVTGSDDSFNGHTATAKKDQLEISGTFSNRECVLVVPETGEWTVSNSLTSDTSIADVKDINIAFSSVGSVKVVCTYYNGEYSVASATVTVTDVKSKVQTGTFTIDSYGKAQPDYNRTFTGLAIGTATVNITITRRNSYGQTVTVYNKTQNVTISANETATCTFNVENVPSDPGIPEGPSISPENPEQPGVEALPPSDETFVMQVPKEAENE